ncbi:anti-sigma-factor antagonist [Calothrix sp. NIES-3974]|nr:anti-sigma-factor antagonist [Calothrix sp. NIES-3974]
MVDVERKSLWSNEAHLSLKLNRFNRILTMQATLSNPKYQVICPQGNINAANALEFERSLITAMQQNNAQGLLVNLEAVESIDSAGLMALVSALKLSQSQGRDFCLCSVSPALRIIFELTQLDRVFEIRD